jgi:excisionase family DNA binding protein
MATASSVKPRLLTVAEAAERLAITPTTMHSLIRAGKVPCVELPSSGEKPTRRIRESDIDAIVNRPASQNGD